VQLLLISIKRDIVRALFKIIHFQLQLNRFNINGSYRSKYSWIFEHEKLT